MRLAREGRGLERELPWRESGEFVESAEIGRKSPREKLRNQVDGGAMVASVAVNVFPLAAVCGGGLASWGGSKGG